MSIEIRYTSKNQKRYKVRVDYKGKRVSTKTFVKRTDAVLYERNALSELQKTGYIVDHSAQALMTFHDALEKYKNEISVHKKGHVQEASRIRILQAHKLSGTTLIKIRSSDIASFIKDRQSIGNKPSTIQKYIAVIQHLFNIARKEWGMESLENPCFNVTKPKINNARDRKLEPGEEAILLQALRHSGNSCIESMAIIAIETAMRKSEILNLRWEHLNLQKRTAFLPITKNGSSRTVPLSSRAIDVFKMIPRSISGKVFLTTHDATRTAFIKAVKGAGLVNLHFHDLRHEATSRLANVFSVLELAKVTGHKDTKMLMRYYHPDAEALASKLR